MNNEYAQPVLPQSLSGSSSPEFVQAGYDTVLKARVQQLLLKAGRDQRTSHAYTDSTPPCMSKIRPANVAALQVTHPVLMKISMIIALKKSR